MAGWREGPTDRGRDIDGEKAQARQGSSTHQVGADH